IPRARLGIVPIALTALSYLVLLAVAGHPRLHRVRQGRWVPVAAAAGAVALAATIGLTAPGFTAHGVRADALSRLQAATTGSSVSSLIDLGKDLHRPAAVPVLDYTTTARGGLYLTLTTLGTFTGDTWTRTAQSIRPLGPGGEVGQVPGLSNAVPAREVRTTVGLDDLHSPWAPAPYPATRVSGLAGRWDVGTSDLTIGADGSSVAGQRYTVDSKELSPTPAQLAASSTIYPAAARADLALPRSIPKNITAAAKKATRGAHSNYQRAVDLQNYFRDGDFTYSLQTPLRQGYNGDGLAVISTFLRVKSGYCVHFASAMAVMARILGIPSRIAIGYLPGVPLTTNSGKTVYTVTSDELHSWPELYFDGIGWVRFEPTVSLGSAPSYTETGSQPTKASSEESSASASTPASSSPSPSQAPATGKAVGTSAHAGTQAPAVPLPGFLLAVLVLLLLPALVARLRRRGRRMLVRLGRRPAESAWSLARSAARDLRLAAPARDETVRATIARLPAPAVTPALLRLRDAVERERYAGGVGHGADRALLAADLRAACRALCGYAGRGRRLAALFAPASLVSERRGGLPPSATPSRAGSDLVAYNPGREHQPSRPVHARRP
ncbi:MAG TPA: transglutaminaseTgpA domain-containing protein, partial [Microbacteriaceae bacterium]|nr:transglutaminaseTgpA domain-containing protein [Microbacteriaceae bacterium]